MSTPTSPRRSTSALQREITAKKPTASIGRGSTRVGKAGRITTVSKTSKSRPATGIGAKASRAAAGDPATAQSQPAPAPREGGVSFPMTTTAQVERRDAIRERTQARLDALRARRSA